MLSKYASAGVAAAALAMWAPGRQVAMQPMQPMQPATADPFELFPFWEPDYDGQEAELRAMIQGAKDAASGDSARMAQVNVHARSMLVDRPSRGPQVALCVGTYKRTWQLVNVLAGNVLATWPHRAQFTWFVVDFNDDPSGEPGYHALHSHPVRSSVEGQPHQTVYVPCGGGGTPASARTRRTCCPSRQARLPWTSWCTTTI